MKKVFVFAALVAGLRTAALAGTEPDIQHPVSIQQRAVALTRAMAEKMLLDEGQYLKLKQINIRMLTEMDDLRTRLTATPAALDEQLAAVQAQYQEETAGLLRPAQLLAFRQLQNSRTALSSPNK